MTKLTVEILEKWKEQGKDAMLRLPILEVEWTELCSLAIAGTQCLKSICAYCGQEEVFESMEDKKANWPDRAAHHMITCEKRPEKQMLDELLAFRQRRETAQSGEYWKELEKLIERIQSARDTLRVNDSQSDGGMENLLTEAASHLEMAYEEIITAFHPELGWAVQPDIYETCHKLLMELRTETESRFLDFNKGQPSGLHSFLRTPLEARVDEYLGRRPETEGKKDIDT